MIAPKLRSSTLVLVGTSVLVAGCSLPDSIVVVELTAGQTSESGPRGGTTPSTSPGAETSATAPLPTVPVDAALGLAVSEYTDAYFAGDWDVAFTKLWSQRCQMDNDERNSFLGTLMAQEVNYPDPARRPRAANIRVDRLEGETAIVTYDYESGTESGTVSSQPWRLEAGEWRFDGC